MSDREVLKQAEIDALLGGVDSGEIATAGAATAAGTPRDYDFNHERPVSPDRLPKLDLVNERFARLFGNNLSSMLHHTAGVSVAPVTIQRFGEFIRTLPVPTSMSLVRVNPLRGTAMVILTPDLVSAVVDKSFGGNGRTAKIEGRGFTATESRIIEVACKCLFADLKEAWSPFAAIELNHLATETNPQFVNQISPMELVVAASFRVGIEGHGGQLPLLLPCAMMEPLSEQLGAVVSSEHSETDGRWYQSLRGEIEHAEVSVRAALGRTVVTLGHPLGLKDGDVVPFDFAGKATV